MFFQQKSGTLSVKVAFFRLFFPGLNTKELMIKFVFRSKFFILLQIVVENSEYF